MKIVITSNGNTPDDEIHPCFSRCPYFLVYDDEKKHYEVVRNGGVTHPLGAGVTAAQVAIASGAEVVLTGNVGPNAFSALSAADIKVVVGVSGRVFEAVERHQAGEYKSAGEANVEPNSEQTKGA